MANANPVVSSFSCMGHCAQTEWIYLEFQFTATVSMSMTTRSSDLDDQKSRVNIQTKGNILTPPSSQNGPEETEAFGSALSCSPSQSPARKLTPDWPETWYCLEIQVISTKDGRMTSPPPHAWQVPVVEAMVWDGKSGLTEEVVTGPFWAILFYVWWSLGEGLSLDNVWDAVFMLSGAIGWVGKQAQLNANLISLGEGWQLITQAITKWCIKPRGPRHPHSILSASSSFNFHNQDLSPWPTRLPTADEQWEVPRCKR